MREWGARRAAVARLCSTAAADWPKLLADALVRELEKAPEAPTDMEGRRAVLAAPPFVLARFPAYVKALGAEFLAHFEERAKEALAAVERNVAPFFEGFSPCVRPQFGAPQDADVVQVEVVQVSRPEKVAAPSAQQLYLQQNHGYNCSCHQCAQHAQQAAAAVQQGHDLGGPARLADGVAFAFMLALSVGEGPAIGALLERAVAAVGDGDWDEASALTEQREKASERRAQLERAHKGVMAMLGKAGKAGDAGFFSFPVRALKHVRSFGGGSVESTGGVVVDLVGKVFARLKNTPSHVMVFDSAGTHVSYLTQGLPNVLGMARDSQGNIFVSGGNNRIVVFAGAGNRILRDIDLTQSASSLRSPHGMAVDSAGNIWVVETDFNRVTLVGPDGHHVRRVGKGQLEQPTGVALGQDGNLYVTEAHKQRVSVFSPDGKLARRFGEGGSHLSSSLGGVAVDGEGCVLVADRGKGRVAVFGLRGELVQSFGEGLLVSPECLAVLNPKP